MSELEMRNAYWNHYLRVLVTHGVTDGRAMAARRLYNWANVRYYRSVVR